jgi:hypothetical protein
MKKELEVTKAAKVVKVTEAQVKSSGNDDT